MWVCEETEPLDVEFILFLSLVSLALTILIIILDPCQEDHYEFETKVEGTPETQPIYDF
jgi:hypothetical protein